MTGSFRLFKWRALARQIAEAAPIGSLERDTAIQFRDGLEAAPLRLRHDRMIRPRGVQPGADHWKWIHFESDPLPIQPKQRVVTLDEALNPVAFPDPRVRLDALLQVFNALVVGMLVITDAIQAAFRRAATDDPDPAVRAWAAFLIDPANHPRPDGE